MKKNVFFSILIIPLGYFLSACCGGDEPLTAYSDFLSFELRNKETGDNLLSLIGGIYNPDTVKIYNQQGQKVFNGPVEPDGNINLRSVANQKDTQAFSDTVSKQYYLYLNQYDTDTIRVDFMLTRDRCKRADFQFVQVYFNDSLYVNKNKVDKYDIFIPFTQFLK